MEKNWRKSRDGRGWRIAAWGLMFAVLALLVAGSLFAVLDGTDTEYIRFIQAIFYSLAIWVVLWALFQKAWMVLAVAIPAALLLPLELWLRLEFGVPISSQSVALWHETSAGEVANFMLTYGTTLVICYVAWGLLFGGAVWMTYRHAISWKNRANIWCLAILPFAIGTQYALAGAPPWLVEVESNDPFDGRAVDGWSREWEEIFPVNVIVALQQYDIEMKKLQETQRVLENQQLNGALMQPERAPDAVVLIIGESSNAERWSLLGYSRRTTPRLEAEPGLAAFSDVVGLSGATRSAIPGVLSRRPVLRPDGTVDRLAEPSLIKAFREAGYQTHWFSNQSPFGKYDAPVAVYAREAEDVRFFNPSTYRSKTSLDEVLLQPLKSTLASPGRHLVVLHTLGSHFDYALRYPKNFDQFQPARGSSAAPVTVAGGSDELISNNYDNSILYTDHVISEAIRLTKSRAGRTLVAYFSDHGVDLPGGSCPYREETRRGEAAYRVPVLFWLSDNMRESHSDKWQKLLRNRDNAYTTRAMYSTLLDIAGLQVSGRQPAENFLTKPDRTKEPRMVAVGDQMVNFDLARIQNSCRITSLQQTTTEKTRVQ